MQITVVGSSEYSLPPERATAAVLVSAQDTDAGRAAKRAQAEVVRIDQELRRLSTGDEAPVTWFSVGPQTTSSWQPTNNQGKPGVRRFQATARIQAKFRDFSVLSDCITAWGASEDVNVQHVTWTLTDETRLRVEAEALTDAVADARQRALAIAEASGFGEVIVEQVADPGLLGESGAAPQAYEGAAMPAMMRGKASSGGADLSPEDVRGTTRVHARFRADR